MAAAPSTILTNAVIRSMDGSNAAYEAVHFGKDGIIALGGADEMPAASGGNIRVYDLGGKSVFPAFTDSHCHFLDFSLGLGRLDFRKCENLAEFKNTLKTAVETARPGEWLLGGRWNSNFWPEGRTPDRFDIDDITPCNPMLVYSREGHQALANSRALKEAGITGETPDPPGGEIRRTGEGQPTGLLMEEAIKLVDKIIPPPSKAEIARAMGKGAAEYLRNGCTAVHDFGRAPALSAALSLGDEFKLRLYKVLEDSALEEALKIGLATGLGDDKLKIGPFKIFADGALGSQTAYTTFDYLGRKDYRGFPIHTPEELGRIVAKANGSGIAVAAHVIGDAACKDLLNALEKSGDRELPNRLEHAQLILDEDIGRIARLKLFVSMQPIQIPGDITLGNKYWGSESARAYPMRKLIDAGVAVSFGSDAPVADIDPFSSIHAAVTRCREDGSPDGGWYEEQAVTVEEAVKAYTINPALMIGESRLKGSLEPGKKSDLVVLSRDLLAVENPREILDTEVLATVYDGEIAYGELG